MNVHKETNESEIKTKFIELLYRMFNLEDSQLTFGIYKIINFKRKEIKEFIDKELQKILEETIQKHFSNSTNIQDSKKIEQIKKWAFVSAYDHLITFFSRYYEDGVFISKRRYSKDPQYLVPYNGEEVLFYWSNKDQYYVKSSEFFRDYAFIINSISYNFKMDDRTVEIEKSNNKIESNIFIIFDNKLEQQNNNIKIYFSYRTLTENEIKEIKLNIGNTLNQYNLNLYSIIKMKENSVLQQKAELWMPHQYVKQESQEQEQRESNNEKSEMEWHLNKFTSKKTFDFFIHKNLKAFFQKEKEIYIKTMILNLESISSEENLQIQRWTLLIFREIADKIIDFMHQIEEFQKILWEKPKFVLSTDYLITLDLIPEEFAPIVIQNQDQIDQWKQMGIFPSDKKSGSLDNFLNQKTNNIKEFFYTHPTLSIDTKFFPEHFKFELLSRIENLEEKITGILINSDNFHALRLLQKKYGHKIKACYIDPPYNTGGSEFIYKNNFQHSSWLTMLSNRLDFVENLLTEDGVLTIAIDDFELTHLGELLKQKFGEEAILGLLTIEIKPSGRTNDRFFSTSHEYAYFIAPNPDEISINYFELSEEQKQKYKFSDGSKNYTWRDFLRTGGYSLPEERPNSFYPIYYNEHTNEITVEPKQGWIEVYPIDSKGKKRVWRKTKPSLMEHVKKNEIRIVKNQNNEYKVQIKDIEKEGIRPKSFWYGSRYDASSYGTKLLKDIFPESPFSFPKSIHTVKDCIKIVDKPDCFILDFFAGSGSTGHAVLQLNKEDGGTRKFILVEMGDYFKTTLKNRIQRVIYSEKWKDRKPTDNDGHPKQIIKYHSLEQYEDSLENIQLNKQKISPTDISDYIIRYFLSQESKQSNIFLNIDTIQNPFNYKINIIKSKGLIQQNIDLFETFNYLLGVEVKKMKIEIDNNRKYLWIVGTRDRKTILIIWRDTSNTQELKNKMFDPIHDKEFIQTKIIANQQFDEIYINGNCLIENYIAIEPVFKRFFMNK